LAPDLSATRFFSTSPITATLTVVFLAQLVSPPITAISNFAVFYLFPARARAEDIGHMLAVVDYEDVEIKETDEKPERYNALLDSLGEKCQNNREDIANILTRSTDILKERGVLMSMYDFGNRLSRLLPEAETSPGPDLTDTAATYIVLLTEKD